MVKITNTGQGPRGVHTSAGLLRFIDVGETVELELSKGGEKELALYPELVQGDISIEDRAKLDPSVAENLAAQEDTSKTAQPIMSTPQSPSVQDRTGNVNEPLDNAMQAPTETPTEGGTGEGAKAATTAKAKDGGK